LRAVIGEAKQDDMPKDELEAVRKRYRRNQPPGVVLILLIAVFSIGTLFICAEVARLVYTTGVAGDIRSRLQADYRPWTPQAFAPVSTGIALGTPEPVKGSTSILDPTATPTCAVGTQDCDSIQPSTPSGVGSGTPLAPGESSP
jgi:hypothetical protein